jgi:ribosomal protein S12 methylthiotransferase accessory factor
MTAVRTLIDDVPVVKGFRKGADRLIEPAATVERVRPHLSRMGITRVANVTGLDRLGIPVVMVVRPNSRALAVAQGKGVSLDAAKASGIMESIETYHAERVELPLLLGSQQDLQDRYRLVDVARLNAPRDSAFHAALPLLWVEGDDIAGDRRVWVPFELVHANFTTPRPSGSGCFAQTSNGLASGNHVLEAIDHAMLELIERDSTTLWSLAPLAAQRNTRIDQSTVVNGPCRELLDILDRAGMRSAAWEMTSDIGVPTYLFMFADLSAGVDEMETYRGYGCHATHGIALLRAITEAAQMRLTIIAGSRDDLDPLHYRGRAPSTRERRSLEWLDDCDASRPFGTSPECDADTFNGEISWMLDRLAAVGIDQVVCVDLTRPEFDIPVARVVIPDLEMAFMEWKYFSTGERARRVTEASTG